MEPEKDILLCDIECYRNFFLVAFKRVSDGRVRMFELSDRSTINWDILLAIMEQNCIVTFNGRSYDIPMIYLAERGHNNSYLKDKSNQIIEGGIRWWNVEELLNITISRKLDHIDLIEPQPAVMTSLKTLNGRLRGRHMQDLPYHHEAMLTHEQMDEVRDYCGNDLDATGLLLHAMQDPLALRVFLGKQYKRDFRSSSDAQIGEAIIKKRAEELTGRRIDKTNYIPGACFKYDVPDFISFENPILKEVCDRLAATDFFILGNGKVELPKWVKGLKIPIGNSIYAMGIGGLHSTEENRAVHADEDNELVDADVASQYPSIIIKLGLYPKAIGKVFLDVYGAIKAERLIAKRAKDKVTDKGLKIALNGVYGKLGSPHSILYAPHLMIAVTLTGQLSLLMLIERAEAAGIPVVSANTDGVVFLCARDKRDLLAEITEQWERETEFELEFANYRSIYNMSVNSYIAITLDGKVKRKGPIGNPWSTRADWGEDGDYREQMKKNPQMPVVSDAVVAYLRDGTPIEDTIERCTDVRDFLTVVNVAGGATWRDEYLGKVVRYYWAKGGDSIFYKTPHPRTGNFKKVSNSDGARPMMTLTDEVPDDINYEYYIAQAKEALMNLGAWERPPPVIPIRLLKAQALLWFALAV